MIDHHLCKTTFFSIPPWPCPACKQGTLQNFKDGENPFRHWPARGLVHGIDEGAIDRWDVSGVFSATLRCSSRQCQQGVAVIGNYATHQTGALPWETDHKYEIIDIHPALLLIDIPEATPRPIEVATNSSFPLYWRDPQACAARLRTAVERVVDHLGPLDNGTANLFPLAFG